MRLEVYHSRARQRRVGKLRIARRMLDAGYTVADISRETGLSTADIAGQRRLMALLEGARRVHAIDFRGGVRGGGNRRPRGVVEATGDLCDILAAPASRSDLRFGFTD